MRLFQAKVLDMKEIQILEVMEQIKVLLNRHGVRFWAKELGYLQEDLKNAYNSDSDNRKREGLEQILRIYGGMGSFSDIFINQFAGDDILPNEMTPVNKKLRELRSQLYLLVEEERTASHDGG